MQEPKSMIAVCFALCGFAVAVSAGLWAGNQASDVLVRAIVVMLMCRVIGGWIGHAGHAAIVEYLERYKAANPIPEVVFPAEPGEDTGDVEILADTGNVGAATEPAAGVGRSAA